MTSATLFKKKYIHKIAIVISSLIILILGPFLFYNLKFMGKIYPNVSISGIDLGGKTQEEAINILSQTIGKPEKIELTGQNQSNQSFELKTDDINLEYNFGESAERAYNLVRTGNFIYDNLQKIHLLKNEKEIGLSTYLDETKLSNFISVVAGQVSVKPIYPSIEKSDKTVQVNKGLAGSEIETEKLRASVGYHLSLVESKKIEIPMITIDPSLNDKEIEAAKALGEEYLEKSINLKFENQNFDYDDSDILEILEPRDGYKEDVLNNIVFEIASNINRDPQNPKFEFDGNKVTEFLPALDGITLKSDDFKNVLVSKLDELKDSEDKVLTFDIPITRTPPDVSTDKINNLGIREIIGRGESNYYHSIPGRVFNVNLAASKINGTLVKPGETFSFNQTVGDISKLTGYKEAYIIQDGRTVLGDGGGVCQVSSTLFRAVLNSGLPITERAAHAYRVGYYEQNSSPGFDATVYAPSPDFKFKNDTSNYILIQAKNDSKKYSLVFEIYGTKDGRNVTISKPVVTDVTKPLPDLYQDDPTLPIGQIKQVDYAAWGAKVSFNYKVTKNGETLINKNFVSNYQPWQAVYLRGTGPAI